MNIVQYSEWRYLVVTVHEYSMHCRAECDNAEFWMKTTCVTGARQCSDDMCSASGYDTPQLSLSLSLWLCLLLCCSVSLRMYGSVCLSGVSSSADALSMSQDCVVCRQWRTVDIGSCYPDATSSRLSESVHGVAVANATRKLQLYCIDTEYRTSWKFHHHDAHENAGQEIDGPNDRKRNCRKRKPVWLNMP